MFETVFLHSSDKGFWACLGDLPPDMPRWPESLGLTVAPVLSKKSEEQLSVLRSATVSSQHACHYKK